MPKCFTYPKIVHHNYTAIRSAVNGLATMPDCPGVKSLVNHKCEYRLRVGAYRVLFDFDGEIRTVEIQEVKKRDERTY
jgi:mRNA interferase RelE/StbE